MQNLDYKIFVRNRYFQCEADILTFPMHIFSFSLLQFICCNPANTRVTTQTGIVFTEIGLEKIENYLMICKTLLGLREHFFMSEKMLILLD